MRVLAFALLLVICVLMAQVSVVVSMKYVAAYYVGAPGSKSIEHCGNTLDRPISGVVAKDLVDDKSAADQGTSREQPNTLDADAKHTIADLGFQQERSQAILVADARELSDVQKPKPRQMRRACLNDR